MSLRIIKAGILDTVQDLGRFGHQHLGINPGGATDRFSASLANALLGKALSAPVIELHFPAAQILFEKPSVICICGADFSPSINDIPVPIHQPLFVAANSTLRFKRLNKGARCYLATLNELNIQPWLNSHSTNLKAGAGGFKGRSLQNNDAIMYHDIHLPQTTSEKFLSLPWRYNTQLTASNEIHFIRGNEWHWLKKESQAAFQNSDFTLTALSDRMGYRLKSEPLNVEQQEQLVSSAVSFGTVQLLPNGQTIVLMADHQTTGGYPRIAHVITAHLSKLAQMKPGESFRFTMTTTAAAQGKLVEQQQYLMQLQKTCNLKMQNWLHAH